MRIILHIPVAWAATFFAAMFARAAHLEGIMRLFASVDALAYLPLSAAIVCSLHDAKPGMIIVVALTLAVGWPQDLQSASQLMLPLGLGIGIGQLCRQALIQQARKEHP